MANVLSAYCFSGGIFDAERPRDASCHWIFHSKSVEAIRNGTIRKLGYGFLFAFHGNSDSTLYHFLDKARYWSKIAIFLYPLHSTLALGGRGRRRNTIRYDTQVFNMQSKNWRIASLVYHTGLMSIISPKSGLSPRRQSRGKVPEVYGWILPWRLVWKN